MYKHGRATPLSLAEIKLIRTATFGKTLISREDCVFGPIFVFIEELVTEVHPLGGITHVGKEFGFLTHLRLIVALNVEVIVLILRVEHFGYGGVYSFGLVGEVIVGNTRKHGVKERPVSNMT
jgi:hypothetical protein